MQFCVLQNYWKSINSACVGSITPTLRDGLYCAFHLYSRAITASTSRRLLSSDARGDLQVLASHSLRPVSDHAALLPAL